MAVLSAGPLYRHIYTESLLQSTLPAMSFSLHAFNQRLSLARTGTRHFRSTATRCGKCTPCGSTMHDRHFTNGVVCWRTMLAQCPPTHLFTLTTVASHAIC